MRNSIRYYYEIEVDEISYSNNNYYFDNYILTEYKKEIDLEIYKYLKGNNFPIYEIIWNKDKNYITSIDDKKYVLLKKTNITDVSFEVLEKFLIPANKNEIVPWHQFWMDKVDHYESHIKTLDYTKLKEAFFYYAGLTENAISFYQAIKSNAPLYISHSRLNKKDDFCNPVNFTLDYKVRDVAEYTKRLFFENRLHIEDLFLFFQRNAFTEIDYLLIYARLLYPSYYFDCYDDIVKGKDEKCLDRIIDKIDTYEEFLRNLYNYLKTKITIPKIDWLIGK